MSTLILDHFAAQPLSKRVLWNSLTGIGWGFWLYLWLPLFSAMHLLKPADPYAPADPHSFGALLSILASHAAAIVVAVTLFLAWSLLQSLAKRARGANSIVTPRRLAQSLDLRERDLTAWQQTQRMVVTHDETSGLICAVDARG